MSPRRATGWTCQKVSNKKTCKHKNPPRTRKCQKCGKSRPAKRQEAHMVGLVLDYAGYIKLNGDLERCAICGRPPSPNRRLDRDHSHVDGRPRGLLCHICNRLLGKVEAWCKLLGVDYTLPPEEWMVLAINYLARTS